MATKTAEQSNLQTPPTESQPDTAAMVIPVVQEEIRIDKRVIEAGKVRITKRVSEREELIDVPFLRQEVTVERVPINLFVEAPPPVRQEGDTMIISIVEEQIVMQKKLLLVEELRVRKQVIETHQPQSVTLLREEVEVTRSAENLDNRNADK